MPFSLLSILQKRLHLYVAVAAVLCCFSCTPSLRMPLSTEKSITVVQGDTVHQVQVLPQGERVRIQSARFYYYFSGGSLGKAEGAYLGKVLHGPYQQHTRAKQLLEQGLFEKGLKVGVWRQWYPAGHLAAVEEYKEGLASGNWISYAPNGSLAWQRAYKEGLPHGNWVSYYPGGSRRQLVEQWRHGKKQGDFEEYYPSGALKRSGSYRNGVLHGTVREYSETGLVLKERYRNGERKVKETEEVEVTEEKEKRSRIRRLLRLRKKKEESEQVQPMLQQQEEESRKKQRRLRWWPFRKKDTAEISASYQEL